jgi:hypothetical protein
MRDATGVDAPDTVDERYLAKLLCGEFTNIYRFSYIKSMPIYSPETVTQLLVTKTSKWVS